MNNQSQEKKEEGRYELYWSYLIRVFSGMRMGEITQFYLDNIKEVKGNQRNKRWCFGIVVEQERTANTSKISHPEE